MPRYPVTIDGRTIEVEADSPEGAARRAYAQLQTEQRRPLSFMAGTPGQEMRGRFGGGLAQSPESLAGEQAMGTRASAFALRTAPGMIPNPLIAAPASAAGEAAAQYVEGAPFDPLAVGVAGAVPLAVGGAVRGVRALGRTATRISPALFERAQGRAAAAAGEMVESLRPTVDVGQLAQGVQAAGGDMIPLSSTAKVLQSITLPAKSANPQMEAVRTTVDNLLGKTSQKGRIALRELEAIRQDIGPLVGKANAPAKLKAIYLGIIRDLETAARPGTAGMVRAGQAGTGSVGAAAARDMATAFKQELGVARLSDLIAQASPQRVISGATVPALNVGTLARLVNQPETRRQLERYLGPDALNVVQGFIHTFRALPPDVAFNGWNRVVMTLGGAGGGAGAGAVLGGIPGAVVGALAPEVLTNMAMVGKNPAALNQLLTTAAQAARAGVGGAEPPPP